MKVYLKPGEAYALNLEEKTHDLSKRPTQKEIAMLPGELIYDAVSKAIDRGEPLHPDSGVAFIFKSVCIGDSPLLVRKIVAASVTSFDLYLDEKQFKMREGGLLPVVNVLWGHIASIYNE